MIAVLSKRSFLCIALIVIVNGFSNTRVVAQGSPYSFLGFGDVTSATNSRLQALSGTGVAMADGFIINELNPAALTYLSKTQFDICLRYSYDQMTLGPDQGSNYRFKIGGLSAGTLVSSAAHLGVAIGFLPVTDAEAKTIRNDSLGGTIYQREGGLSEFYLGAAVRPTSALALGGRLDILFGNVRTIAQANITGDDVQSGIFQREYSESGLRGTFGFMLSLDSLFSELRGLTIGASFSTASSLTSTQRTVVTPINATLDSTIENSGYGYYPSEIKIGLAGRFGDRFRIEANLSAQDFSNAHVFTLTKDAPADPSLGPSNRYSFALERLAVPIEDSRGVSFWEKVGLRFGASYMLLPYRPAVGVTVHQLGGSFGLGIPFPSGSAIDIAAELGIRTPSDQTIAPKDLYFKLGLTVTITERWFVPLRKTDDD
ncbi:MAG TPA: hypothetical protein VEW28_02925 [Candidatus Kapabacteria bacterium]|nr:hypothetical protein [Candidatus Kapabacteria bacterium]